jgi:cyclase
VSADVRAGGAGPAGAAVDRTPGLARRVIPCLDVRDGPVEAAARYDAEGADELVFLDITASHEGRGLMRRVAERVAETLFLPFTVGGGLSGVEDVRAILAAGADKVSLNTAAVRDPALITACSERFGAQAVVVAIDARRVEGGPWWEEGGAAVQPATAAGAGGAPRWEVTTHGGRHVALPDAVAWAREAERRGAGEILLTSMDADGTRAGYDLELLAAVSAAVNVPVIASGGAGTLDHFAAALAAGADAVLAASLFHFRELTVPQVKEHLASRGIPVRR